MGGRERSPSSVRWASDSEAQTGSRAPTAALGIPLCGGNSKWREGEAELPCSAPRHQATGPQGGAGQLLLYSRVTGKEDGSPKCRARKHQS